MKTTIVCGVLGAGKTTFLRNILRQGTEKTVVLVNDFGSAGIDGEILSAGGIETIELPSGCVCCTLKFDLITSIQKIMEQFEPEHLFIEPSGVAAPSGVLDALDTLKVQPVAVVGIVDATEFADAYEAEMYGWFFKSQVTGADIILVNKTDLIDNAKRDKTMQLIESLNQTALIIPTVNAELDGDLIRHHAKVPNEMTGHEHTLRTETITLKLEKPAALKRIKLFFEALRMGKYGQIMRAKALIQTDHGPYRFDIASKQLDVVPFEQDIADSRIVIIGTDLQEDTMRNSLR